MPLSDSDSDDAMSASSNDSYETHYSTGDTTQDFKASEMESYAEIQQNAMGDAAAGIPAQPSVPMRETYKPTRQPVEYVDDAHWHLIYKAQCADLQIAQRIGAMASLPPLDSVGNVHSGIWAPKLFPTSVGRLTDSTQLAKSMWSQMEQQITDNKAVISKMDDMQAVPDWQYNYIKIHEERLQKHTRRVYDISPSIEASMHECMFRVQPHFLNLGLDKKDLTRHLLDQKKRAMENTTFHQYKYLPDADVSMRFLFRHHITRDFMCTIAGRILNKQEVCNRPGAWASTKTRHDLTRDIDEAIIRLWDDDDMGATWMRELQDTISSNVWNEDNLWTIIDHTIHQ